MNQEIQIWYLTGNQEVRQFQNRFLTKNLELDREVQAWTSWVYQEVIGFTGKLLFFHSNLLVFAGKLLFFIKKFFHIHFLSLSWKHQYQKINCIGVKPIDFYVIVFAVL